MTTTSEKTAQNMFLLPTFKITVNGLALSDTLQIVSIEVQQSLHLPSMFVMRLFDPEFQSYSLDSFAIGSPVEIKMGQDETSLAVVFKGEISGMELDCGPQNVPVVTVRGYDKLYRLHLGRQTRTFLDVKDSDLVSKIAGETGLSAAATDTGGVYKYVLQHNETNLEFLQRRLFRIGKELFVDDTTLKLRDRATTSAVATFTWGENILGFSSRLSVANQVSTVSVSGWDSQKKEAILGQATTSDNHPTVGESRTGSSLVTSGLNVSGTKITSSNWAITTQSEAEQIALAIYDDLSGRFIQIEGTVFGDPILKPGVKITLKGMGTKFNGDYYLSACTHRMSGGTYETTFESNGRQNNSLYELTGHSAQQTDRVYGVVIGIVTNIKPTDDPDGIGSVKVKFPTFGNDTNGQDIVSNWARIASPMAGASRGFFFLPEVNDEVLVAFEQGDINHPYILGVLWNGKDASPKKNSEVVDSDGTVKEHILKTRSGHTITFNDSESEPKITIIDKTGNNKITVDSTSNTITIESDANLDLKAAKGTITLDAKDIVIKGSNSAKMNSINVTVEATQNVEVKGTAAAKMSGAQVEVTANASGKITSTGILEVKGSLLKLN